ncbi:MAG: c-type cytochrome [Lentisphaerae bacterium]|nr:c-type cytochrome [Lentisphaerota bacterium]
MSDNLTFLSGIRQRIQLPGVGPRALLVSGDSAWIADYFSDTVSAVALDAKPPRAVRYALGASAPMDSARRGEMLFNDATTCFQQWQSCESCHPDARTDGLNWDLLNDGIGNPKNTKNMLLAHATPPAMISGIRSNAETAVRAGMKFIKFSAYTPEDAEAIDAYLKALKPIPSPFLENGRRSARRGGKLFAQAGCARCHPPPLFTDRKAHDVGTASGMDAGRPFDTPTLIESWRTAPYLNDGRSATLRDVLTRDNPGDRHGKTSRLSPQELADLIEFIRSQ